MTAPPLFVIPSIQPGGAELLLMLQLAGLRRRGLAPRLIVLSDRIDPQILARAGMPRDHILVLGMPSAVLNKAFLRRCPGALARAARFVAAERCGRAVALLPPAHFFARLLKLALLLRGHRVRLYQYHHSEENMLAPRDTAGKRLFFGANQLLARLCDHAHWHVSERVRADICSAMATCRDAVLHNTCEMDAPGDNAAAEDILAPARAGGSPFVVLLPGRLLARKGHELLIAVTRRLVAEAGIAPDQLHVLFAGDGPERGRIEAAVADAGLQDYVTLLGTVPHPTLLALFGKVDLVVVPSLIEGFGIVAIEALSRGALLIASDAAGLDEIVRPGKNALQFPVGDAGALYQQLAEVWCHRHEALIDRDAAARDVRQRFGPEAHLDRLTGLLDMAAEA